MNFGGIILARMDSVRLPGKPLIPLCGRPLMDWLLDRCSRLSVQGWQTILATTDRAVDDPLVQYAESRGIQVFRGSAEDVAGRVLECATRFELSHFFRLNGDSPLVDAVLLEEACQRFAADAALDFVTNIPGRSYPYGMSVEAFRTTSYRRGVEAMTQPAHREHVTAFFYENLPAFACHQLRWPGASLGSVRLTVDTPADVLTMERLIKQAGPQWSCWPLLEVAAAYQEITA